MSLFYKSSCLGRSNPDKTDLCSRQKLLLNTYSTTLSMTNWAWLSVAPMAFRDGDFWYRKLFTPQSLSFQGKSPGLEIWNGYVFIELQDLGPDPYSEYGRNPDPDPDAKLPSNFEKNVKTSSKISFFTFSDSFLRRSLPFQQFKLVT